MEHKYDIKSKLYVKPTKVRFVVRTALLVALIVLLLSGIISIITKDFSLGTLGYMAIAFVVITGYIRRPAANPHYESTYATVTIGENKISIEYRQLGKRFEDLMWTAKYDDIAVLEYSDKLECLRFLGTITIDDKLNFKNVETKGEHLLYIERGEEAAILEDLSNASGIAITYVDRQLSCQQKSEQGIRTLLNNNFKLDFQSFKNSFSLQGLKDTFRYNATNGGAITMQDWKNSLRPRSIVDTMRYNLKYNSFRGLMENGRTWENAKHYIKDIGNTGKSVMNFAERIEKMTLGTSDFTTEFKDYVDNKLQKSTDFTSIIHDISELKSDFNENRREIPHL